MKDLTDFERELIDSYEKLDKEAGLYNRPEFDEVYKLINDSGDLSIPLITGEIIDEALKKAGFANDQEFVGNFKKYREIEQKARDIQLIYVSHKIKKDFEQNKVLSKNEWKFLSPKIILPEFMQEDFEDFLEEQLKEKKGFYSQSTEIEWQDEKIDELLMIDIYGIKSSLEPFYRELQEYSIHTLINEFGGEKDLMEFLKVIAVFIKDNTNKPNKIRNKIIEILKEFDTITGIGLIWQILLLQGILRWIEGINIKEGDDGFVEAELLYNWIAEQLIGKEVSFCRFYWGDNDKEKLKPLCEYLYSTEIGEFVQNLLFAKKDMSFLNKKAKIEGSFNKKGSKKAGNQNLTDNENSQLEFDNSTLHIIMNDDCIDNFLKHEKRLKADGFITPNNNWKDGRGKNQTKTMKDLARLILLLDHKFYLKKKYGNKKLDLDQYKYFFERRYNVSIKEQFNEIKKDKNSLNIAITTFPYF